MTIEEYFGDWSDILDLQKVQGIMQRLVTSKAPICPFLKDVFKAFRLCPFSKLKVILLAQDPYSNYRNNKPVATGLAFANPSDTYKKDYSPSLKVLRDSLINICPQDKHIIFDPSLESWEKQGVLLLNTALTCEAGRPESHMLLWRPFITDFLTTLAMATERIVYVLMGSSAQSLEPYINHKGNSVLKIPHPSWYARTGNKLPPSLWKRINEALMGYHRNTIEWFEV